MVATLEGSFPQRTTRITAPRGDPSPRRDTSSSMRLPGSLEMTYARWPSLLNATPRRSTLPACLKRSMDNNCVVSGSSHRLKLRMIPNCRPVVTVGDFVARGKEVGRETRARWEGW